MSKRIKTMGPEIASRAQMEELVGRIAELELLREDMDVEMNRQIQQTREIFQPKITNADTEIARLIGIAKTWSENNVEEFGPRKSIEMVHAVVGFRTGTPKLKTLTKWTWDRVKAAILVRGLDYIRTKEEVDKEQILSDREQFGAAGLSAIGLKVVQEESFFVEPKRENIEPARKAG